MSIATEITRLQTAKSDLKTSIENKGVTVPASTLISGYSALVDQISGGGGGNPVVLYFTGWNTSHGSAPVQCNQSQALTDSEYIQSNNDGTFTVLKAGTYTVCGTAKGGYSGGTMIYMQLQVTKNGTAILDTTTTSNAPSPITVTESFNVNDVIGILTRNVNGNSSLTHFCAVGIQPT